MATARILTPKIVEDYTDRAKRRPRYTFQALAARFIGLLVWIAITVPLAQVGQRDLAQLNALQTRGRVIRATRYSEFDILGRNRGYFADGRYVAGSRNFDRYGALALDGHDMVFWQNVLITYLPAERDVVREDVVTAARVHNMTITWICGAGALSLLAAVLISWCFWSQRRQMRLLKNGELARAIVTTKGFDRRLGVPVYTIIYTFSIGEEQHFLHGAKIPKRLFDLLNPGDRIITLYLPENPEISLPYEAITAARL